MRLGSARGAPLRDRLQLEVAIRAPAHCLMKCQCAGAASALLDPHQWGALFVHNGGKSNAVVYSVDSLGTFLNKENLAMSREEVSRILPPGKPKDVDPEKLAGLLRDAFRKCLEVFSGAEPSSQLARPIYRPAENGSRAENINIPFYSLRSRRDDAISSDEVRILFDYLWNHRRLQKTPKGPVSAQGKPDQGRSSWEKFAFHDIIRLPLSQILQAAAIDEAVTTGEVTPWRLPEEELDRIVEEVTWRISNKEYRYTARCLLAEVESTSGKVWDLGNGIRLCRPTEKEYHKYLSQNSRNLPLHNDAWTTSDIPILEVKLSISQRQIKEGPTQTIEDILSRQVGDAIDLIKWALMVSTKQHRPLVEGEISFECYSGGYLSSRIHGHHIKRQNIEQRPVYRNLDEEELNTVRELLKHTPRVREQSNHVYGALWHFGRSCLAQLRRDILLESVIGLEHLLTSGRSSGYQFRLYGAALMAASSTEAENIASELKDIYEGRSAAVHSYQEETDLAGKARQLLAKAVYSVMELVRDGELLPAQRNIPEEIQKRVLREVPFRSREN